MNYANQQSHSDVTPFEILNRISDKTIEIRAMRYERDPSWKPLHEVGGFCGHCVNQSEQVWTITPDESNEIIRIRQRKNGRWYDKFGNEYSLSDKPRRFYDYNF